MQEVPSLTPSLRYFSAAYTASEPIETCVCVCVCERERERERETDIGIDTDIDIDTQI